MSNLDSFVEINLSVVKSNYLKLCAIASSSKVGATVKSDGYGLGLKEISTTLYSAGCRNFFVHKIEEGAKLRSLFLDVNIFILHGLFTGEEEDIIYYNLIPVLNNIPQVETLYNYLKKQNITLLPQVALHVDTGINRLGMVEDEVNWFHKNEEKLLQHFKVGYIISHLSNSFDQDSYYNTMQLENFCKLKNSFRNVQASLANSSGIFLGSNYHFDLVRPGAANYGINPTPKLASPVVNPVRLVSKIIQIVNLTKCSYVGYNLTYLAPANSKIATISIGYANGFPRSFSQKGKIFLNNIALPVVGQVSMNLVTIDVTHVPSQLLYIGQEVEIIGKSMSIDEFAKLANISPYELLIDIGKLTTKKYIT